MDEQAAFDPTRCREMGFDELRDFIDGALDGLPGSEAEPELPGSEEEFLSLLEMLREKAPAPGPQRGVQAKRTRLTPEQRLVNLRQKRKRTELFLLEQRGEPSATKKAIRDAEHRWEELKREIRELEDDIRYGTAEHDYWANPPEPAKLTPSQKIERLRRKIERTFHPEVPMIQFQWEAVPKGTTPVDSVAGLFRELQRHNPRVGYDEERLEKARSIKPKQGYMGKRKFDGYVIFTFDHTPKALMECPIYGNAIFVISSALEPERWLKMKKQDLMEHPEVTKIPHREGWFERVKEELEVSEEG